MARAKEFDEEAALSAAADLFWRKGFEATSIRDLVEATGVNRASLYATFGDKQDLFQKALSHYENSSVRALEESSQEDGPGFKRIGALFRRVAEQTMCDCRGCMLTNAAIELSTREPWMADTGRRAREHMEQFFLRCLEEAESLGEIRAGLATPARARYLTNSLFGLRLMSKMNPTRALVDDIVETTLAVFH